MFWGSMHAYCELIRKVYTAEKYSFSRKKENDSRGKSRNIFYLKNICNS